MKIITRKLMNYNYVRRTTWIEHFTALMIFIRVILLTKYFTNKLIIYVPKPHSYFLKKHRTLCRTLFFSKESLAPLLLILSILDTFF